MSNSMSSTFRNFSKIFLFKLDVNKCDVLVVSNVQYTQLSFVGSFKYAVNNETDRILCHRRFNCIQIFSAIRIKQKCFSVHT